MNAIRERSAGTTRIGMAVAGVLVLALGLWGASTEAAQTGAGVNVTVNLFTTNGGVPSSGTCSLVTPFGATVLVSCTPGNLRFITRSPQTELLLLRSPVEEETPVVQRLDTSWRKVMVDNQEFFEIMVRW